MGLGGGGPTVYVRFFAAVSALALQLARGAHLACLQRCLAMAQWMAAATQNLLAAAGQQSPAPAAAGQNQAAAGQQAPAAEAAADQRAAPVAAGQDIDHVGELASRWIRIIFCRAVK